MVKKVFRRDIFSLYTIMSDGTHSHRPSFRRVSSMVGPRAGAKGVMNPLQTEGEVDGGVPKEVRGGRRSLRRGLGVSGFFHWTTLGSGSGSHTETASESRRWGRLSPSDGYESTPTDRRPR